MKTSNLLIIGILLVISSCGIIKYAKEVNNDALNIRLKEKNFIYNLELSGIVYDKHKYIEWEETKYRIVIKPDNDLANLFITTGHLSYFTYYSFSSDSNLLEVAVPRKLFEASKNSDRILKTAKSDSIDIGGEMMLLLNKDTYKWVPD